MKLAAQLNINRSKVYNIIVRRGNEYGGMFQQKLDGKWKGNVTVAAELRDEVVSIAIVPLAEWLESSPRTR